MKYDEMRENTANPACVTDVRIPCEPAPDADYDAGIARVLQHGVGVRCCSCCQDTRGRAAGTGAIVVQIARNDVEHFDCALSRIRKISNPSRSQVRWLRDEITPWIAQPDSHGASASTE
jgi:hypothetical protein